MRAIQITSYDGPSAVSLDEVDDPTPQPDQVLIDVRAAGVSFPELLQTRGMYQMKPPLPYVPGHEAAGVVVSAPEDSGFSAGDRVCAFSGWGAMGERFAAPAASTFRLPDAMSFAQGAAYPMNYHTAYFCLVTRGAMTAGDTVLIHGAAGGVGTATIQTAKAFGASTIAVVSSDEKAQVVTDLGADHVVRSDGAWKDDVLSLTDGRGVDLVMDPVGGDRFTDSLRSLAPEGRLLVVGFAAGSIPEVKVNRLLLNNISVVGCAWGAMAFADPGLTARIHDALLPHLESGAIAPPVGAEFPMAEAADAFAELDERRATGKVVLTVGDVD